MLRATRVWDDRPECYSRRARYTAGEIDGHVLPSYVDDDGIDAARQTETLAEVVFAVDTWRWAGVPFRVRSGKAIGSPRQEVTITFKDPQRVPSGLTGALEPNQLRMSLGPRRLALDLNINGAGDPFTASQATLEAGFGPGNLLEYGEVLRGVLDDEKPLSVRDDNSVDRGESSNRSSTPGTKVRCRSMNTAPGPPARRVGVSCHDRSDEHTAGGRERFVEMTPAGLRRVRTWAVLITIGSFLFGYDTGNRLRHQVGAGNSRPTRN